MVAFDLRSIPSRLSGANFCNVGRPDGRPGMLAMSISARHHLGVLGVAPSPLHVPVVFRGIPGCACF